MQCWSEQYKIDTDTLEGGLCRDTETGERSMKHMKGCYEVELFRLEMKSHLISVYSYLMGLCGGAGAWLFSEGISGRIRGNEQYFRLLQ